MKLIATYGSLREGGLLHHPWIGSKKHEKLGTHIIPNFELYNITGSFPAACPSTSKSEIVVDVFSIEDSNEKSLAIMEEQAGYKSVNVNMDINESKNTLVTMYVMDKELMTSLWGMNKNTPPIGHGDWIKFYNNES